MATLIDTNVLIDIAVRDPAWLAWSRRQLERARRRGSLLINQVVYSEFAMRYETMEAVEAAIPASEFRREGISWEAAFAAARAFQAYRRLGGRREKVMPDFYIGAHAAIRGHDLLTRDPSGFRSYFPGLAIIAPDTHP